MMITTNCKPLDWMISKAEEYTKDAEHVVYRFRGNVPARMKYEVQDWMKAQGAHYNDGRTRSSWGLVLEDTVDENRRWYRHVSVNVSRGCCHSTANTVEIFPDHLRLPDLG